MASTKDAASLQRSTATPSIGEGQFYYHSQFSFHISQKNFVHTNHSQSLPDGERDLIIMELSTAIDWESINFWEAASNFLWANFSIWKQHRTLLKVEFKFNALEVTHLGAHSDEAAWQGVHEVVLLGEEEDDPGVDGAAGQLVHAVLADQPGPDLDLLAHLQHVAQNRAASHAPPKYSVHN